jgi:hypothetical protein
MPSSVIGAHNYDPGTSRLEITFVSGKVYVYEDVAPQLYAAFSAAFSRARSSTSSSRIAIAAKKNGAPARPPCRTWG